jgi:hypothetical protein
MGMEVMLKDLRGHLPSERTAVLHGMMKMKSCQDARPVHLLEPILGAVESMRSLFDAGDQSKVAIVAEEKDKS